MGKKRILLTGGSGFIGRNFSELMGGKYEISAPAHRELDLADSASVGRYFRSHDFDAVVHAANIGGTRKTAGVPNIAETNLRSFFNLANSSSHFGKMVHIGSGAEYDKFREIKLAKEEEFGSRVPPDSYGFYKYVCSKYIEKNEGITCIRPFGVYGKYEDYELRFISNSICRAIFGLPVRIANQNVRFSYIHVDDLCRIISHFIDNKARHKFYNATPDEVTDLVSIAGIVNQVAGRGEEKPRVDNPGMGREYSGDNARLKSEIIGINFIPMKNGVEQLYSWYEGKKQELDLSKIRLAGE